MNIVLKNKQCYLWHSKTLFAVDFEVAGNKDSDVHYEIFFYFTHRAMGRWW